MLCWLSCFDRTQENGIKFYTFREEEIAEPLIENAITEYSFINDP